MIGRLGGIASVFPQLFVANRMETAIRKKPLLKFAITIRALSWGMLALATYIFNKSYPHLTIFFLFFTLILHTVMGGIAVVPFYDIWGKVLPFYRKFIVVEITGGAGAMALPFYILYLRESLGMQLGMVGILLSAQMFGSVLSNILWAHLSDFVGNKKVIQTSTFIGLITPLIALASALIQNSFLYIIIFILIGFFISGRKIGKDNYLLDIAPSRERPKYISLTGTLLFPVSLFPLLGGVIVQYISYQILFFTTAMFVFWGFILSFGLSEPREAMKLQN